MSKKFHLKPDGTVGECKAEKGQCRYYSSEEHLTSLESAEKMNDFRNELEVDLVKALNHFPIESMLDSELSLYRKLVVDKLDDSNEKYKITVPEDVLTDTEKTELKQQAEKIVLENGFTQKIEEFKRQQDSFNFKPGYNGVPKGLLEDMKNKTVMKTFAKMYFVDSNNNLSVDDFRELNKRALVIRSMSQYSNFQNSLYDYEVTAMKNIQNYLLVKNGEEALNKEFNKLTQIKYDSLVRNHPKVRTERTKSKLDNQNKVLSRREIIANINKEILIRKKLSNFGLKANQVKSRTHISEFKDDVVLPFKPKEKDGNMDNVFLFTSKKQFYKVELIKDTTVQAKDYQGANYELTYKNDSRIKRKLDLDSNFTFFEVQSKQKEDFNGLIELKKN